MAKLIKFDWAIKKILRDKANFDILEGFLTELLKYNIKVVEILESESNKEDKTDKFNRVDLLVKNDKEELIIIEVQVSEELDYFHRILFGTSKLITEYISAGKPYREIKKIISINIVYFDIGSGEDYIYYGSTNFVGLHKKDILHLNKKQQKFFKFQDIKNIFPEYYLIKVEKFNDIITDNFDEWVYLLKNDEVMENFKSKNIQKAGEKLKVLSLENKERKDYEKFLDSLSYQKSMFWSSREIGRQEGIEKGKLAEKLEIVKNSLKQGLDFKTISLITGLSLEEIEKLKESFQNA